MVLVERSKVRIRGIKGKFEGRERASDFGDPGETKKKKRNQERKERKEKKREQTLAKTNIL